jgi:general secretion pathway protein M
MARVLTRSVSRFAAVGLLIAVLGVAYGLGVASPLARYEENSEEISHLQAMLIRYQRVAAEIPRIRSDIEALGQESQASRLYLQGSTDALAAAHLVDRLKQLVQGSEGRVSTAQNLPAEGVDSLQKIAVRIQFTGSIETVQRVLHAVETERPMLFIDAFEIRSTARSQYAVTPESDPDLGVRLDISGYLRPEAG